MSLHLLTTNNAGSRRQKANGAACGKFESIYLLFGKSMIVCSMHYLWKPVNVSQWS
jgi:hypothetical protein